MTSMERWAKITLGLAAAAVVLGLFLLPLVTISVEAASTSANSSVDVFHLTSASASMMYAYFGVGAVQVSNPYGGGHTYCLMSEDPGTMCGFVMHRMNQMMTP
jgi:hypothetical protein